MKRKVVALLLAAGLLTSFAAPGLGAPGAGDRQCKPGQTGNPNDPPKHPPSCPGG